MPQPVLKPRADQIRMPSLGLVGLLSGSGFSQVLVVANVKTWLNIGIADVSGLTTALENKQPLSSALTNLAEQSLEDFGVGVLSIASAADMRSYIGAASLVGGLVPASQLPSYVDDVLEFANLASFPVTGEAGKIYVALNTGRQYRWAGSIYARVTDDSAIWGNISGILANQTDLVAAFQPLDADLTLLASHGYEVAQDVLFAETITWTGTTAPSSATSLRYSWVRVGKLVTFEIRLVWSVAGSALTNMVFALPAGMPTPSAMTAEGASDKSVTLSGQVSANALRTGVSSAMTARLSRNAGAWEIYAPFASTNLTYAQISGSYICQ